MWQYLIAGLATGGIYAIFSMSIVVTYNASRVFNFAQAGIAFALAYLFYEFNTVKHLSVPVSFVLVVLVIAPLLGLALWWLLLGRLAEQPTVVKIAATIGLQVALSGAVLVAFGHQQIASVHGLISSPRELFRIAGVNVSNEQFLIIMVALAIGVLGAVVLYGTPAGLVVRGSVDSPLMSVLVGTNPKRVAACVWMAGTAIAGIAGILVMPQIGLDSTSFARFMAASLAGVVIGRLTNVWLAFGGAILVGVAQSVITPYLPSTGLAASAIQPSLPFAFMVLAMMYHLRSRHVREEAMAREVASVASKVQQRLANQAALLRSKDGSWDRYVGWVVLAVVLVVTPFVLTGSWLGTVVAGLAFAVVFLSNRAVTAEAGIINLCQVTLAGIGAVAVGQLTTVYHVPVLLAVLLSAVVGGIAGIVVGLVCLPLGQLYAAITTFAIALLADQSLFVYSNYSNFDSGVIVSRPSIGSFTFSSNLSFYILLLVILAVLIFLLYRLRRSMTGLLFASLRSGRSRAETFGFRVNTARMAAFILGAGIAALGGALIATNQLVAYPAQFDAVTGLTWFAVAVAQGSGSMGGAVVAGVSLSVLPQVFSIFLPARLGDVPTVLFGLAAIMLVNNPQGVNPALRAQARQLARWTERRWRARKAVEAAEPDEVPQAAGQQEPTATTEVRFR
jgi:branched-chain amino acid transport system permease protein